MKLLLKLCIYFFVIYIVELNKLKNKSLLRVKSLSKLKNKNKMKLNNKINNDDDESLENNNEDDSKIKSLELLSNQANFLKRMS
jgi:hypothetical protein